jgi:hypothetical protein
VKFANYEGRAAAADGEHAVDVADTSGARTCSFSRTPAARTVPMDFTSEGVHDDTVGNGLRSLPGHDQAAARATDQHQPTAMAVPKGA